MDVNNKVSQWHIGVAAEAFAAALFARCGFDISIQYGADQPEYDLIVKKGDKLIPVSVKGSQDGSWGLTQSHLINADYRAAADLWLKKHSAKTILCFIQFKNVSLSELPRVYLATPSEVAERLKATAKGRGDTILYEHHEWGLRAHGAGTIEEIPESWHFSIDRLSYFLEIL